MSIDQAPGRYRDAFAVPEFRAVFGSHVISMLGAVMANLALTVMVFKETDSPLMAALVLALAFMPYLVAGMFLSSLVDRIPTRRLIVTCNVLSAAVAVVMALPKMPVPALLVLAFSLGLIAPIFAGTRAATLPDILPGRAYPPGRSLLRLVTESSQMGGYAVGGLLLTGLSPRTMQLVNAACFVASALILRFGTYERPPNAAARIPILQDSLAGLRRVMQERNLRRVLVLGWAAPMLGGTAEGLVVPYAHELGTGSVVTGLLMSATPTGFILGELLMTWLFRPIMQVRLIPGLVALIFAPLLIYAISPGAIVAFVILIISGAGYAHHIGLDRLLIDIAPGELCSRALSIQATGLMFWQGVGLTAAGAAAEVLPSHVVVTIASVCGLLVVVPFARQAARPVP